MSVLALSLLFTTMARQWIASNQVWIHHHQSSSSSSHKANIKPWIYYCCCCCLCKVAVVVECCCFISFFLVAKLYYVILHLDAFIECIWAVNIGPAWLWFVLTCCWLLCMVFDGRTSYCDAYTWNGFSRMSSWVYSLSFCSM